MKGGVWTYVLFALVAGCGITSSQKNPMPAVVPNVTVVSATLPSGQKVPSVKVSLSDGPGIANLINTRYNSRTSGCAETDPIIIRGLYYCSGVLLRTTDVGPFYPWEPSPTALQLGATSYSWIRSDLNTSAFYKPAGFILLSPYDVSAKTVPGVELYRFSSTNNTIVKCVYPFDAWTTRTMSRRNLGCDFEGTGLGDSQPSSPWGSCDDKLGYTTADQWNGHFEREGRVNYKQCSWNADNIFGWANMIASHNAHTGQASWNEVMLYNAGPEGDDLLDYKMMLWIVAFFYDTAKSGSLADAQEFQRKMAVWNKRAPILKLDFSAPATSRFSFTTADQVAYP